MEVIDRRDDQIGRSGFKIQAEFRASERRSGEDVIWSIFAADTMMQVSSVIIVPEQPQTETIKVPVVKVFDGDGFLTRLKARQITGNPWDQADIELTASRGHGSQDKPAISGFAVAVGGLIFTPFQPSTP